MKFLIISKDRACQAHALINSIQKYIDANTKYLSNVQIFVVYKASSEAYLRGYEILQSISHNTLFLQEEDSLQQTLLQSMDYMDDVTCLLTDDCMFFRTPPSTIKEIEWVLHQSDIFTFSYRLGLNTTVQNYEHNILQPSIQQHMLFINNNDLICYNYKDHHKETNYGLHFGWDGMCYNTSMLRELFDYDLVGKASNPHAIYPQQLENYMSQLRDYEEKTNIACNISSSLICMNYNSTHPHANFNTVSLEYMNHAFLTGQQIDIDSINFYNVNSCHQNLPFSFKKVF